MEKEEFKSKTLYNALNEMHGYAKEAANGDVNAQKRISRHYDILWEFICCTKNKKSRKELKGEID